MDTAIKLWVLFSIAILVTSCVLLPYAINSNISPTCDCQSEEHSCVGRGMCAPYITCGCGEVVSMEECVKMCPLNGTIHAYACIQMDKNTTLYGCGYIPNNNTQTDQPLVLN